MRVTGLKQLSVRMLFLNIKHLEVKLIAMWTAVSNGIGMWTAISIGIGMWTAVSDDIVMGQLFQMA